MKNQKLFNRRYFLGLAGATAGTYMTGSRGESKAFATPGDGSFSNAAAPLVPGETSATGAKKTWGIFLANHNQDTGMHLWKLERWKRQIADLKRMGAQVVWFLPMEFGQHSRSDFEDMAPYWSLQRSVCRAIAESGLEVGIYVGLNDVLSETSTEHPAWRATRRDEAGTVKYGIEQGEVCPSIPPARAEILRLREKLFAGLPQLDYVQTEGTDYGGCGCDMCAPWAKTYLKVFEEYASLCKRYHPNVKVIASGWNLWHDDEEMLRNDLRSASWVDYVWEVPRGPKPVIKGVVPEITMINGWGRFGPCPILGTIQHDYTLDRDYVDGSAHYSEGIHDDVNKFAVLQFGDDPHRSVDDVARAYAEDWLRLNGRDAALAAQVIAGLGTDIVLDRPWQVPAYAALNPEADERVKVLIDVRARSRTLGNNFRYWLLHYRALCESLSARSGSLSVETLRKEAAFANERLAYLEPEYSPHLYFPPAPPDYSLWHWPREFNAAWRREISFSKSARR